MLPGGLDEAYRGILGTPHRVISRVEVWSEGVRIDPYGTAGVRIASGSVTATLTSRVARTLSITVDRELMPQTPSGLLAPFGNYLKVYSGVRSGASAYEWIVFYGRITDTTVDNSGTVSVSAADLANDLQDDYFGSPYQSGAGVSLATQFRTLVNQSVPGASFGVFDPAADALCPKLTWNTDRAAACDDLANAGNMFWYPLSDGEFVMRQVAWTSDDPALLTLSDGPGGSMLSWSWGWSRNNVWNQWTVTGERAGASTPVYAVIQDQDPSSPTFAGGKFGRKGQYANVQSLSSQGQALSLAKAYLRQSKALTETWTAQLVPDAALELGDVFYLAGGSRVSTAQVVSAFTLSIDSRDTMNVTFRAQTPGPLSGEGV